MRVPTDIEIAQSTQLSDIRDIAKEIGIEEDDLELYGKYKAKVNYNRECETFYSKVSLIN